MRLLVTARLLLCCVASAHAQLLGEGPCPDVEPVVDFDVDGFVGVWYEFERSPVRAETPITCLRQNLGMEDGKMMETAMAFNTSSGKAVDIKFSAKFTDGKVGPTWSYYSKVAHCTGRPNVFKVLQTDYTSYYMGMFCRDLPYIDQHPHHTYQMWIFTRKKSGIGDVTRYGIYGHMIDNGLDPRDLSRVSQNCGDITLMDRVLYVP